MNNCTGVGYFIPIIRIHTLVLFIAGNARFHGLLFFDFNTQDQPMDVV